MAVDYSGKVRSRDPESSWDAAAQQTPDKVDVIKAVILDLLNTYGPMTDEQLVDRFDAYVFMHVSVPHATPQNIRTRRKALEITGSVRDTGRRGRTRTHNTATIWEVAK